jgi:hypothetical protein
MQYSIYFAVLIVIIFSFTQTGIGQDEILVDYTFTGDVVIPDVVNNFLSASDFQISSGSITLGSSQGATWTGSGVPYAQGKGGWAVNNADEAKYFFFTLEGLGGTTFHISNISFLHRATGAGPSAITLVINDEELTTIDLGIDETVEFEFPVSGYENLSFAEIKIKGWENFSRDTISGTGDFRIDDVLVTGSVSTMGVSIIHTPLNNTVSTGDRILSATITGNNLVIENNNRPVLWYSADGGDTWIYSYYNTQNNNDFTFTIPGQSEGTEVLYYIAAKDADGVTTHPYGGEGEDPPGSTPPQTFHSYTILETTPNLDGFAFYFTTDPENVSGENRIVYPHVGMGKEDGEIQRFGDDWTYIDPEFTFYLVVQGDDELIAAEFYLNWDHTFGEVDIELGTLFPDADSNQFTEVISDGRIRVNAASLTGNVRPEPGDYLATISVKALSPGHMDMFIDDIKLRYYDEENDEQIEIPAESFPGEIKFYLGDFGRSDNNDISTDRGDGVIDFNDLMLFASAYWSKRGEDDVYRTKFDIGPTNDGRGYFAMPLPNGAIDFEDLVVFAIGYYKSIEGQLAKNTIEPIRIIVHEAQEKENSVILPLGFEGNITDLRAISLEFNIADSELAFVQATPAGELDGEMGFLAAREVNGIIQLDAAIIRSAFTGEGVFVHLHFEKRENFNPGYIGTISAIARNSNNRDIPVEVSGIGAEEIQHTPVRFSLSQNYPNPFNPVTIIEYQLSEKSQVTIVVYNILGEKVAELISGTQDKGYHSIIWDGMSADNKPASSGLYIYRMKAGDYVETKRMVLLK